MKLLVAGDARVDAGKTTFAAGLVAAIDGAVGFKPSAGNDYWYDHDTARAALDAGRLYGKDVTTLAAVSDTDHPEEWLNPVHRLWRSTRNVRPASFLTLSPRRSRLPMRPESTASPASTT